MELNKIYKYYGIQAKNGYSHAKEKFTEAFTGFEGVSFETVEATDETTEQYKIYLDSEKSMWLLIYVESSYLNISISFKDGTVSKLEHSGASVSSGYLAYNIMKTAYGVAFTALAQANGEKEPLNDSYFMNFFAVGEPNVFVCTSATDNLKCAADDVMFSILHETPEVRNEWSTLNENPVLRTKLFNYSSLVYPIDCEHLYRVVHTDGKTGKVKIGEKYFIIGMRYALELDPNDDGKEV